MGGGLGVRKMKGREVGVGLVVLKVGDGMVQYEEYEEKKIIGQKENN